MTVMYFHSDGFVFFCVYMCFYYFIWLCVSFLFPSLKTFCTLTSPAGIEYITLYVVTFSLPHLMLARPLCVFHYHPLYSSSVSTFSHFPPLSFFAIWFSSFSPPSLCFVLNLFLIYSTVPYFFSYAFLFLFLPTLYPLFLSQHGSHPFFNIVINIECVFWSVWVEGDRQVELSQSVQSVEAVFTL